MPSQIDIAGIERLLERLDPTPMIHCGVPGCVHLDAPDHEQDGSPPLRLAA